MKYVWKREKVSYMEPVYNNIRICMFSYVLYIPVFWWHVYNPEFRIQRIHPDITHDGRPILRPRRQNLNV